MNPVALATALHVLASVIWVGGMFFAFMALRPAAYRLEPAQRFPLWNIALGHFFPWVWFCIFLLLSTGFWLLFSVYGGMAGAKPYLHMMLGIGIIMMLIFAHVFFAPYQRLRRACADADWESAQKHMKQIRLLVAVNLGLGVFTVLIAVTGKYVS